MDFYFPIYKSSAKYFLDHRQALKQKEESGKLLLECPVFTSKDKIEEWIKKDENLDWNDYRILSNIVCKDKNGEIVDTSRNRGEVIPTAKELEVSKYIYCLVD